MIERFKSWNRWRKTYLYSDGGRIHKLLVLLGLRRSVGFDLFRCREAQAKYITELQIKWGKEFTEKCSDTFGCTTYNVTPEEFRAIMKGDD